MNPAKLFISHAHEDKKDFVDELVQALQREGHQVWYDTLSMTMGDSLLAQVSKGLRDADFGVVVLSPSFFKGNWTKKELDGLITLEQDQRKVILPIWKDVTFEDVVAYSPIIASKLASQANRGISAVIADINRAVETTRVVERFSKSSSAASRLKLLDEEVTGAIEARKLSTTVEGVEIARKAVESITASLRQQLLDLGESTKTLKIVLNPKGAHWNAVEAFCPYHINLSVYYQNNIRNSLETAYLRIGFSRPKSTGSVFMDPMAEPEVILKYMLRPRLDSKLELRWEGEQKEFTTEQIVEFILDELNSLIVKFKARADAKMR